MCFLEFLKDLASDRVVPNFAAMLITRPNLDDNYRLQMGDRWCSVLELIRDNELAKKLLYEFAFERKDPKFSFSAGDLKAQYIPDEDFCNNGSAIVLFALVGSQWTLVVHLSDQNPIWALN